ncbi:histidine phosphatase family protein [Actinospica robiniae]|uniref:histidine phosphatase family protein n=1 Tax=Actinospica robiniae TaxID=304901 RepID=UPI00040F65A5|nr:phosphoglycerate mutase family protein [Actinospica robiniae]
MTDTEIILIRHGEAWDNKAPAVTEGLRGLSAHGVGQARRLAAALADDAREHGAFDALYTSPSLRCLQTSEPVASALALKALVAHPLRPPEAGVLTSAGGLVAEARPDFDREGPTAYAESAAAFLRSLPLNHPGQRVLVVGHQVTARTAMAVFLRLPVAGSWWGAPLEHGALTRWTHRADEADPAGACYLTAHNTTAHLDLPDEPPPYPQLADIRKAREQA